MVASFVSGASKVFTQTEPRFIGIYGKEVGLRNSLIKELFSRPYEFTVITGQDVNRVVLSVAAVRPSRTRLVYIEKADAVKSWDWLSTWFATVKGVKIVADLHNWKVVADLDLIMKSKGMVIDCSSPGGNSSQQKLVTMLGGWYGYSHTQLNLLLAKNDWRVTECMQLLDKLNMLNLPLTAENTEFFGVERNSFDFFIESMQTKNARNALIALSRMDTAEYRLALKVLSSWLDQLARVKLAHSPFRPVHEIALEVGLSVRKVETLHKQAWKFDLSEINKASLLLARADKYLQYSSNGVLENLINLWQ